MFFFDMDWTTAALSCFLEEKFHPPSIPLPGESSDEGGIILFPSLPALELQ